MCISNNNTSIEEATSIVLDDCGSCDKNKKDDCKWNLMAKNEIQLRRNHD